MKHSTHPVFLCSLAAALAAAAPVTGQVDERAMVPAEFVKSFLLLPWLPDAGVPELLVGRLPAALTERVRIPDGARAIGSVAAGQFTVSALVVPGAEERVTRQFGVELARAGWSELEQPHPSGSFQVEEPDRALLFCQGDSLSLALGTHAGAGDSTGVHLLLFTGRDGAPCASRPAGEPAQRHPLAGVPVPKLELPAGVRAGGSGSCGSEDSWHFDVRLRTDMTVDALLRHYRTGMEAQGWRVTESVERGEFGVASLERRMEGEPAWLGILTVAATGSETRVAMVRLIRLE